VNRGNQILLALIIVLTGALVWVISGTLEPKITSVGDTAPDFKITADSGKVYTRQDFGGKVLVLNFWASWCAPCVEEVPSLEAFQQQMKEQGVVVLGVSIDINEKLYKQFLQRFRVTFPTARDPQADISFKYGTFQIPETYIIDAKGKVVEKIVSNTNWMDPAFLARVKSYL
jgi:cytochrome c biogenesis protein CcmG, thiol:disulfide interchange protein DsbE